ncbi:MAG: M56 family metallopeptidase [Clostridia bacterium]|nr:M56 family metallopeptidase [Clostridia bacterium]
MYDVLDFVIDKTSDLASLFSEIFLNLINMSISASWLILIIILIRLIFRRIPKSAVCFLWILAASRLVIPFSFESVLSLIPSEKTISMETVKSNKFVVSSGISAVDTTVNDYMGDIYYEGVTFASNFKQIALSFATVIWLIVMSALIIFTVVSFIKTKRRIFSAVRIKDNFYYCDGISSPFVFGTLKPKIYLPFNICESDIEYVVAHESAHIKRLDYLTRPLWFLILCIHWFNPLAWVAYVCFCRDTELACDEKAIKDYSEGQLKEYSKALLRCSTKDRLLISPVAFGEIGLKERIINIKKYKKPAVWVSVLCAVTVIIVAVFFMTNPAGVPLGAIESGGAIETNAHTVTVSNARGSAVFTDKNAIDFILGEADNIKISKTEISDIRVTDTESYENILKVSYNSYDSLLYTEYLFSSDFSYVWRQDSVKPTKRYRVKRPQEAQKFFNECVGYNCTFSPNAAIYENESLDQIINEHALFPVTVSDNWDFNVALSDNYKVRIEDAEKISLTTDNFDALFNNELKVYGLSIKKLRRDNYRAWRLTDHDGQMQYLFMEQTDSEMYFAVIPLNGKSDTPATVAYMYSLKNKNSVSDETLNKAIYDAIIEHNSKYKTYDDFATCAFTVIATEEQDEELTVYASAMYTEYRYPGVIKLPGEEEYPFDTSGCHTYIALTFRILPNGNLLLKEYWEPRDGSYYANDIRRKFPVAVDFSLQDIVKEHMEACDKRAYEYFEITESDFTLQESPPATTVSTSG